VIDPIGQIQRQKARMVTDCLMVAIGICAILAAFWVGYSRGFEAGQDKGYEDGYNIGRREGEFKYKQLERWLK
jgi:hypothetical protein